ncbi:MAG: hypothetical protein WCV88_00515 [Patescibacteria group bacterium]|jgi:hypothetical protein
MTTTLMPKTILGKISIGLNILFFLLITVSILLVVIGGWSFDWKWWDVTLFVASLTELIAFITGIVALLKYKDYTILVYISFITGILAILFVLLHSLFIND